MQLNASVLPITLMTNLDVVNGNVDVVDGNLSPIRQVIEKPANICFGKREQIAYYTSKLLFLLGT